MSGGERDTRLGTGHVATLNILFFRNESTCARPCGVTRRFLRNRREAESSNSEEVTETREKARALTSLPSLAVGLALSPTGEARRQCDRPPQGSESGDASRERSERASAERQSARERRSRRKRGPAPDPEADPHEARRGGPRSSGGKPQRRLSVQPAPAAEGCGALGCREADDLLTVRRPDGQQRVLCRSHVPGWLRR